jgi:hypothetical protein
MSRSFSKPLVTIASAGAIMTAILIGGVVVFLSGVLEVSAEPQVKVAVHQSDTKSDRLQVLLKGAACSSRGWPNYEQGCQFDMRRLVDDARTVRVIALR